MGKSRFFLVLGVSGLLIAAAAGPAQTRGPLRGSGEVISVERDLAGFQRLQFSHACRAAVACGERFGVKIMINSNLKDHLNVRKEGSLLIVGLDDRHVYAGQDFRAEIQCPDLKGLSAAGRSQVTVTGFDLAGGTAVFLSGDSSVRGDLKSPRIQITLAGSSQIEMQGGGKTMELTAAGASRADLARYPVTDAAVNLSGASEAVIHVSRSLEGQVAGASVLIYDGSPEKTRVLTSGGSISREK